VNVHPPGKAAVTIDLERAEGGQADLLEAAFQVRRSSGAGGSSLTVQLLARPTEGVADRGALSFASSLLRSNLAQSY
jgi:hypothetical protein